MISNAEDLAKFRNIVNGADSETRQTDAHAKLTANITLSSENWTPIGRDSGTPYTGKFDGSGYSITNLTVNLSEYNAGLFGIIGTNGLVENLTVAVVSINNNGGNGSAYAGGIVGLCSGGTIENCIVEGTGNDSSISSGNIMSYVGGIAGGLDGGTIKDCKNNVPINGNHAGGITGSIWVTSSITGCSNGGTVYGGYAGGIVGDIFSNQATNGTFTNCRNSGAVTASMFGGGIVGRADFSSTAALRNCSNSAAVNAARDTVGDPLRAGGIIGGINDSTTIKLENCSNSGSVIAATKDSNLTAYAGGIAGNINNARSVITLINCVTGGTVEATATGNDSAYNGGIAGYVANSALSNVTNCAYPTGMNALGGNDYYGDNTITGANAINDVKSAVTSVYAEIDNRIIAPNGTAKITLTTAPGEDVSKISFSDPISCDGSIIANAIYDNNGTITVTAGAMEGTANITFSVMLTDSFASENPVDLSIPVTVTAGTSEGDSDTGDTGTGDSGTGDGSTTPDDGTGTGEDTGLVTGEVTASGGSTITDMGSTNLSDTESKKAMDSAAQAQTDEKIKPLGAFTLNVTHNGGPAEFVVHLHKELTFTGTPVVIIERKDNAAYTIFNAAYAKENKTISFRVDELKDYFSSNTVVIADKTSATGGGSADNDTNTNTNTNTGGGGGGGCSAGFGALALLALVPMMMRRKK